jgi:hypothetical protein
VVEAEGLVLVLVLVLASTGVYAGRRDAASYWEPNKRWRREAEGEVEVEVEAEVGVGVALVA